MTPYGCHNSKRTPGYYAPQRIYHADGSFVTIASWVDDKTSIDCQYRQQIQQDPRCAGCKK